MDDWKTLVAQIRAGDPMAGPVLVNSLAGRLDKYAAFRAADLSQADREAAVERALEKVVLSIDTYDDSKGTLLTWARSIVRNELAEARRSSKEVVTDPGQLPRSITTSSGNDPTADEAIAAVDPPESTLSTAQIALESLVLQLSEADSTLLRLHALELMTFQEIADQLGPPATADNLRQRYGRTRRKLRDAASLDPDLKHLNEEDTK